MEYLDTGRIRVAPKEGTCLHFRLYADGEVPGEDFAVLRSYLDQFDGKVSFIVTRDSDYWLSADAQKVLFRDAASRVKAVAYVDRDYGDTILSDHADKTYLKGVEVSSFASMDLAFQLDLPVRTIAPDQVPGILSPATAVAGRCPATAPVRSTIGAEAPGSPP